MAIRKAKQGKKGEGRNQIHTYYFDIEKCKYCPFKEGCYKDGAKSKTYLLASNQMSILNRQNFKKASILKKSLKNVIK